MSRGMETDGADALVAAVVAGDADAVRELLGQGVDPDTPEESGLPVLCRAVAAYDAPVAEALVKGGADPDRVLPDGTTPLERAIDGGSPAVFSAVLGAEPRLRLPEDARERLLGRARHWYETGVAEELRRRTGASGPATTVRVQDDEYDEIDQVSLGGLVVRAGHAGILSSLEWAFRVLPPVEELIDRAIEQPDEHDANWWAVLWALLQRRSHEAWSAVVAHRHGPSDAHRRFVLEYLRVRALTATGEEPYEEWDTAFLADWAAEEPDGETLAKVLDAFTNYDHPDQEAIGLRHAGHPDPRVRREVPYALCTKYEPRSPAAREALRTLTRDPDAEVRLAACTGAMRDDGLRADATRALLLLLKEPEASLRASAAERLATSGDRAPAVADALAALLDDGDQNVLLEAGYGLARRDDPRTADAIERVGRLSDLHPDDHRVSALWRWEWERKQATAGQ
ncbi:HEAT repeat domain-containing protein [Streptomyces sp. NPDC049627]|uniref:HEAT repeat domain-containing protein n=1 Tax=Streptomyces sp. NPDC049627 TaxID=3365595 RepID=UPI0037962CDB